MSISKNFLKVLDELEWQCGIPLHYQELLEERLVIICTSFERRERHATRQQQKEYTLHYQQKRAKAAYLCVLGQYPHTFLPFLLATTPRSARTFKLRDYNGYNAKQDSKHLSLQSRWSLESIAIRRSLIGRPEFYTVIQKLFPSHVVFDMSLVYLHNRYIGRHMCAMIDETEGWTQGSPAAGTTRCMRLVLGRGNEDAYLIAKIKSSDELVNDLFQRPDLNASEEHSLVKGASVQAIQAFYSGTDIDEGIDLSKQRSAEKELRRSEDTDCIQMIRSGYLGTLYIRFSRDTGVKLSDMFYLPR